MFPTIQALIKPRFVTIEGCFCGEVVTGGINPFERRYSFQYNEEIVSVDLDPLSKKIMYKEDFYKGEMYKIVYERGTNLIVHVSKIT